jgi:hypothetical protein
MNYAQRAKRAVLERVEDYAEWGPDGERLLEMYALLALVKGEDTTLEDIHDAWALHTNRTSPGHPSLVPFEQLEARIQAYDEPYMNAVREAAREIHEREEGP